MKNYFNSDIYKSLVNKVDSISTKPSLQAIMTDFKKTDMRFFDKSFIKDDASIDEIKIKINICLF